LCDNLRPGLVFRSGCDKSTDMQKALVIGATGGIGRAMCAALAAQGVAVTQISRAEGLDVTDPAAVDRVMDGLDGPFDLIFVALGILALPGQVPEKTLSAVTAQAMAGVFAVNTIGPALILRHTARLLRRDGRSVVAVLSARVGSIGDNKLGGWYSYRASKAALNQIVHGAAIEIGRSHRQAVVVALHPGTVATAFTAAYSGKHAAVTPEVAAGHLLSVLNGLTVADSGGFFDWAGTPVPW
jgi:NAD(P)-dependent dehydrogenase (short-subunit alcohol dehydrogenase family)